MGKSNTKTITPDPYRLFNKIMFYILCGFWGFLILFGILTLIKPFWLRDIANTGRAVEAQTLIDQADSIMYKAHRSNSQELYSEAINLYIDALRIDSLNLSATMNLGVAYLYTNHKKESEALFNKLLTLDSTARYEVYLNFGDLYERNNEPEKALGNYLMAAQGHQDPAYLYRKIGLFYSRFDKYDEAISYLNRSIELEKSFEYFYVKTLKSVLRKSVAEKDTANTAFLREKIEKADLAGDLVRYDAKAYYDAHKIDKGLGYAHLYLGDVYSKKPDQAKATENYNKAIEYFPEIRNLLAGRAKGQNMPIN